MRIVAQQEALFQPLENDTANVPDISAIDCSIFTPDGACPGLETIAGLKDIDVPKLSRTAAQMQAIVESIEDCASVNFAELRVFQRFFLC